MVVVVFKVNYIVWINFFYLLKIDEFIELINVYEDSVYFIFIYCFFFSVLLVVLFLKLFGWSMVLVFGCCLWVVCLIYILELN